MQTLRSRGRLVLLTGALALVFLFSPAGARPDEGGNHHGRVQITFTKWILNGGAGPFMAGVTGGDVDGVFQGEVLQGLASRRVPSLANELHVIYEVQAGDHSFSALLQGGQSKPLGVPLGSTAVLNGFVLAGWRSGSPVHVEWTVKQGPESCPAPPEGAGPFCFVGTITIERAEHHDDGH